MKIQVLEGALTEAPTADATGMDRRAFGEMDVLDLAPGRSAERAAAGKPWTTEPA
ncbi:hypothetical protein AB0M02_26280 [Actinoplanes sp. NPDC051861]|uniref:hypothetical protein n=1 Tax=Actinoplanes sp. NPDC051861 TaxID=3155170 RepID=UPI00341F7A91